MDRNDPELQEAIRAAYNTGVNHAVNTIAQAVLSGVLPPSFDDATCDLTQPCVTPSDGGLHALCVVAATILNQHRIRSMMRADTWASENPIIASALSEVLDTTDGLGDVDGTDTTDGAD